MIKVIYHGSNNIIQIPKYGYGKTYNDYGLGFYCTEHIELAKEWACNENKDGFVNKYSLDLNDLNILNLNEYTILHWLALLVENRSFHISSPIMKRSVDYLKEKFLLDISSYDIVIGYRADDSYFAFAKAFLNNTISFKQLSNAMYLGELGEQIVLKSEKAFNRIKFINYENVNNEVYYPKRKSRDELARLSYQKELEIDVLDGLYMRDIIREEVTSNDERLR